MHHRTIQINHQHDATIFQFIILTFIYSSTCFGRFPAHHQELNDCSGSLWFYLRIVVIAVLCSWSGRPAWPRTRHDYHHDTKVNTEAATAVIELLMMGEKRPKHVELYTNVRVINRKIFASGWWFELNVKLRCQKLKFHIQQQKFRSGLWHFTLKSKWYWNSTEALFFNS
jgi:hypothetical protein